jgi:DMSO/TMAO reductase YedYZ molybdopterin-dependent catalytic subunit
MVERFISRGFKGRARETDRATKERIPPGQYETNDFPVLSAGPTPRTSLEKWDFSIYGEITEDLKWSWDEFRNLPRETVKVDIHCVTKWSKLDTVWTGVSVDTLLAGVNLEAHFVTDVTLRGHGGRRSYCDGGSSLVGNPFGRKEQTGLCNLWFRCSLAERVFLIANGSR